MASRVCVFVDGENLRHSIVELFGAKFNRNDYLPKKADWTLFYNWLCQRACSDQQCQRVRTYWYVVDSIEYYPRKVTDPAREPDILKSFLMREGPHKEEIQKLDTDGQAKRIQEIFRELQERRNTMQKRFDGWTEIQNGICTKHQAIEFRRAGTIRYNLFEKSLGKEKAVDVKLAVDMIILHQIYDIAIIVSGDQDYVPAVQVAKDWGKKVINVCFETRSGDLLPGGAKRLNQHTDTSYHVPYKEFENHLAL